MEFKGFSTILPSYTIPTNTTNRTSPTIVINSTNSFITSPSTVVKGNSPTSSSSDVDMLFTWVFIACVVLGLLLIISICMVILCWKVKRRRRFDGKYNTL